jgi:hypothetical protein
MAPSGPRTKSDRECSAPALDVYVHLFPDDDATEDMAALGALATGPTPTYGGNVVGLRG